MSPSYRDFLLRTFDERRARNAAYSLRAFSRDLGIAATNLSAILKKKKGLSEVAAEKIAERLSLNEHERALFRSLVAAEHSRSPKVRETEKKKAHIQKLGLKSTLSLDKFKIVSQPYHFLIVELLRLPRPPSRTEISQLLGITPQELSLAFDRLEKLEILKNNRVVNEFNWSTDGIPSEAIRKFHEHLIQKSLNALFTQPVSERDFSSMMFTFDPSDLPAVRLRIRSLLTELTREFSEKPTATSVYGLSSQFFNLTPTLERESKP